MTRKNIKHERIANDGKHNTTCQNRLEGLSDKGEKTDSVVEVTLRPGDRVGQASCISIIQMMEEIRRKLMVCFVERRKTGMEWSEKAMLVVPSAEKRFDEAMNLAKDYTVRAREGGYEVTRDEGDIYIVDARNRSCTCGRRQQNGVPRFHAVAALSFGKLDSFNFVENYFAVFAYRVGYSQTIHPILDRTQWQASAEDDGAVDVVVNPPESLRPPAAQPKKRQWWR